MALLTPVKASVVGSAFSWVSVDPAGDQWFNSGHTMAFFEYGEGGDTITVSFVVQGEPAAIYGIGKEVPEEGAVPPITPGVRLNPGQRRVVGPFLRRAYNDTNGLAMFRYVGGLPEKLRVQLVEIRV